MEGCTHLYRLGNVTLTPVSCQTLHWVLRPFCYMTVPSLMWQTNTGSSWRTKELLLLSGSLRSPDLHPNTSLFQSSQHRSRDGVPPGDSRGACPNVVKHAYKHKLQRLPPSHKTFRNALLKLQCSVDGLQNVHLTSPQYNVLFMQVIETRTAGEKMEIKVISPGVFNLCRKLAQKM